jgi:hypothetical protein
MTVSATVAEALNAPETPVIVTVTGPPIVVVLVAVSVSVLELVAGFDEKPAVTPEGNPETLKATLAANPFAGAMVIVSVVLLPCIRVSELAEDVREKLGGGAIVSETTVVSVSVPETPVMVSVTGPVVAAELDAVSVSVLVVVAGLGEKLAVTPAGSPETLRFTFAEKPLAGVMRIESVVLLPGLIVSAVTLGARANIGGSVTVSATLAVCVSEPEAAVIVKIAGPPTVAVVDAVSVNVLPVVAGLGEKLAVTPVGSPETLKVTLPEKLFRAAMVNVSVTLLPWPIVSDIAEAARVKLGGGVTVSATLVVCVSEPETPVMVSVTGPTAAAELEAVSVNVLSVVAGLGEKLAVTPVGNPETLKVTLPVKPFAGVITMEPVVLLPATTTSELLAGATVKVGEGVTLTLIVSVCVSEPEVPVMVMGVGPLAAAVLSAARLRILVEVVCTGEKLAVTPTGNPVSESETAPVNPPSAFTVIVLALLPAPVSRFMLAEEAASVNPEPMPVTVTADVCPAWSLPVSVTLSVPTASGVKLVLMLSRAAPVGSV